MATSHSILKETPRYTIVKQVIATTDGGTVLDLSTAKNVTILTSHNTCTLNVPQVDANGVPEDNVGTVDSIQLPANDMVEVPTSTTAGRIGAGAMPLFLQLGNSSSSTEITVYVYIIHDLHASESLNDSYGTAGSRVTSTAHG